MIFGTWAYMIVVTHKRVLRRRFFFFERNMFLPAKSTTRCFVMCYKHEVYSLYSRITATESRAKRLTRRRRRRVFYYNYFFLFFFRQNARAI